MIYLFYCIVTVLFQSDYFWQQIVSNFWRLKTLAFLANYYAGRYFALQIFMLKRGVSNYLYIISNQHKDDDKSFLEIITCILTFVSSHLSSGSTMLMGHKNCFGIEGSS